MLADCPTTISEGGIDLRSQKEQSAAIDRSAAMTGRHRAREDATGWQPRAHYAVSRTTTVLHPETEEEAGTAPDSVHF